MSELREDDYLDCDQGCGALEDAAGDLGRLRALALPQLAARLLARMLGHRQDDGREHQ